MTSSSRKAAFSRARSVTSQWIAVTVDPLPRFTIEAYDAKSNKRVDMPAGNPPPPPKNAKRPDPAKPSIARVTVAANGTFQSGSLGTGAACFETQSRLTSGEDSGFGAPRQLTVNGRPEPLNGNWSSPLPPLRHNGYCIQTTPANNDASAAFSVSAGPN